MASPVHITYVTNDPDRKLWHVISESDPNAARCGEAVEAGWLEHAGRYMDVNGYPEPIAPGATVCDTCRAKE